MKGIGNELFGASKLILFLLLLLFLISVKPSRPSILRVLLVHDRTGVRQCINDFNILVFGR